ncbi:glycerophosphodiester phosphodiesterase family protein [Erythrobacteraceae bacterium WH01K]|nr:glycerophosphodiester phosphodiesterase family protein [Erythrobacteraceae bacterium WH01K]
MKRWAIRIGGVLAVALLGLTLLNASWLAPEPKGAVKLIAHGGIHQHEAGIGRVGDTCTAALIEDPVHDYLENTLPSIERAASLGAHLVEIDVTRTRDGRLAVFGDDTVDCRTDGSGATRNSTLGELKALDIGHGYTADDGSTYPFRGKGTGMMPALEEAMAASGRAGLLYRFKSEDAEEADLLATAIEKAGRDTGPRGDAFYGSAGPVARIRQLLPDAWAFTRAEAEACSRDYVASGWTGHVPQSCRNGTIIVPLDRQWAYWGWPNRMIARLEAHGTRIVIVGPQGEGHPPGLDLPEQLGEIPASFNGYAFVDDSLAVIPALIQRFDDRSQAEIDAVVDGLERRRANR